MSTFLLSKIFGISFVFATYLFCITSPDPILYEAYDASSDKITLQAPLNKILELTHLTFDGTAKDLINVTQKAWIRPKDKQRWEIDELNNIDRETFLQIFEQLDMIKALDAPPGNRDLAIMGGATSPAMKKRLCILVENWQRGDRYKKIAILTGDRPMDPHIESDETTAISYPLLPWKEEPLSLFPKNENQLGSWLVNHIIWPQGMQERFLILRTEKSTGKDAKITFIDTLKCFRNQYYTLLIQDFGSHPTALLISSQPHAHAQLVQAQNELGDWLRIELAAYSCPNGTKVSVMLDALARWIYSSLEMREKNK